GGLTGGIGISNPVRWLQVPPIPIKERAKSDQPSKLLDMRRHFSVCAFAWKFFPCWRLLGGR
ncbi:unnamed protein product, partial [Musa textilis]